MKFVSARGLASALFLAGILSVGSARATTLNGTVQTGGICLTQPLAHVPVTLFEATTGQPIVIGQATTNQSGHFSIQSQNNTSSSIFYVSAVVGGRVEFLTVLGTRLPATVTINELTTVAASYSMAQFYKTDVISGNSFGLRIAAGMNDNIVTPATGESSLVLLSSPNADESNSLRSTRSLANLFGCVCAQRLTHAQSRAHLVTQPEKVLFEWTTTANYRWQAGSISQSKCRVGMVARSSTMAHGFKFVADPW